MGQVMRFESVISRLKGKLFGGAAIAAIGVVLCASPAFAQTDDAPSQSAMVNLIHLLVKQGVITQKAGDALLKQAEAEAVQARTAPPKQKAGTSVATLPMPESAAVTPPPPEGTVRIPYIPAIVKKQITEQVKQDVMAQAQAEGWAQPKSLPGWLKHVTFSGDMRFRDEQDLFGSNNIGSDGVDGLVNYAAFNANGPTDVNPNTLQNNIPFLNTTQDRYNQLSIRVHLGVVAQVTDKVLFGIRLASGNDNGPVSTTQLLGGGLDKKNIWLDQTYLILGPFEGASFTAGRMPNPFFHTDLVWDENLNFDGAEISEQTKATGSQGLGVFGTVGAFPIGYIGANFPDYSVTKQSDRTEWLLGAQLGSDWQAQTWDWKVGVSLYDYRNAQGQLFEPMRDLPGPEAMLDGRYAACVHAEGKYALPVAPDYSRPEQPHELCATGICRVVDELQRNRRQHAVRYANGEPLSPDLRRRLRPQSRLRRQCHKPVRSLRRHARDQLQFRKSHCATM